MFVDWEVAGVAATDLISSATLTSVLAESARDLICESAEVMAAMAGCMSLVDVASVCVVVSSF